jgi:hypothetical protein
MPENDKNIILISVIILVVLLNGVGPTTNSKVNRKETLNLF